MDAPTQWRSGGLAALQRGRAARGSRQRNRLMTLQGQRAIVLGGSSGIGLAATNQLASEEGHKTDVETYPCSYTLPDSVSPHALMALDRCVRWGRRAEKGQRMKPWLGI